MCLSTRVCDFFVSFLLHLCVCLCLVCMLCSVDLFLLVSITYRFSFCVSAHRFLSQWMKMETGLFLSCDYLCFQFGEFDEDGDRLLTVGSACSPILCLNVCIYLSFSADFYVACWILVSLGAIQGILFPSITISVPLCGCSSTIEEDSSFA